MPKRDWPEEGSLLPQIAFAPADDRGAGGAKAARILIVEDDYFVALEVEHHLLEAGFDVVGVAVTAEEAVAKAVSEKPELVIMDIRLSGVRDGVDAAIEISAMGIRSIFATANSDTHTRKRAELARPAGWLQKPYSPQTLVALVRGALAERA